MGKSESYVRAGKGHTNELGDYMLELHRIRLEELSSCRNIVEKIAYGKVCASRSCNLIGSQMLRISKIHLTPHLVFLPAGLERNLGHSCNRSQSLTTETESQYVLQVLCRMEL